jgi:hypothetical protein
MLRVLFAPHMQPHDNVAAEGGAPAGDRRRLRSVAAPLLLRLVLVERGHAAAAGKSTLPPGVSQLLNTSDGAV